MKNLKFSIAMFYIILALAGGISVTSCSEAEDDIFPELQEQRGNEDDDGQGTPPPPPCTDC